MGTAPSILAVIPARRHRAFIEQSDTLTVSHCVVLVTVTMGISELVGPSILTVIPARLHRCARMGAAPSILTVIPARLHRCARIGAAPSILTVIPARLHRCAAMTVTLFHCVLVTLSVGIGEFIGQFGDVFGNVVGEKGCVDWLQISVSLTVSE